MKIAGLQKMTLLDFPGKVACTVFLPGCNFRCPFCHNGQILDNSVESAMEPEALLSFLKKRQGLLDGVAVTGGEPCLHAGLYDLIAKIRSLGYTVKLDTNGNHPDLLKKLLADRLVDYVAMDIKNSPGKYAMTIGLKSIDLTRILRSIDLLKNSQTEYEFRTTVVAEFHEADDFEAIGDMIRGASRYYLQSFTDRETVPFGNLHAPSKEEMLRYKDIAESYVGLAELRGVD